MPTPENEQNGDTSTKLDAIIKLLAAMYTKGSNKTQAITKLADLQLNNKLIADIVGVSSQHVRQILYITKKTAGKKNKKQKHSVEVTEVLVEQGN